MRQQNNEIRKAAEAARQAAEKIRRFGEAAGRIWSVIDEQADRWPADDPHIAYYGT